MAAIVHRQHGAPSASFGSTYLLATFVPHRQACGPPLSVGSIYRSRSGAKTNTPDTYCIGPSTRHSTLVESGPTTTA